LNEMGMEKRQITLQEVQRFVKNKENLRAKLVQDYLDHMMLREADLQACVYFHLRGFLKSDKRWRVLLNAYHKGLGRYPDLTIMEQQKHRLAIELKWRSKRISGKDRGTLSAFLEAPHARKAYFLTMVKNKSGFGKLGGQKTDTEKNRLMEIAVNLDLPHARSEEFKAERKSIKEALR
jgi:hypothetical protein